MLAAVVVSACGGGAPQLEPPRVEGPAGTSLAGAPVPAPEPRPVPPVSAGTSVPAGSVPDAAVTPLVGGSSVSATSEAAGAGASSPPAGVSSPPAGASSPSVGGGRGVFVDVSAGLGYSCGLRVEGFVDCWEWGLGTLGEDWWELEHRHWSDDPVDAVVPGGVFMGVSAGWGNACGVRPSGVLECWGSHRDVVVSPPVGVFSEVSVGVEHACAVRVDERVVCWGSTRWRQPVDRPPEGVFTDFTIGFGFGCGVRVDGSVECWGEGFTNARGRVGDFVPVPEGEFKSVHAWWGQNNVCGLRAGGGVECWGDYKEREGNNYLPSPEGEFASLLAVRSGAACGSRPTGVVECWGLDGDSWLAPTPRDDPAWVFGEGDACGVFTSAYSAFRVCWDSGAGSPEEVTGMVFGYNYICGLRPSGEAVCDYFDDFFVPLGEQYLYRYPEGESPLEPPGGAFTALTESDHFVCGLRPGGAVECWGQDLYGETSPPEGRFTQLKAGSSITCGLRLEGELECWGFEGPQSRIVPPSGSLMNVHAGWGGLAVSINGGYYERMDWGYSCGLRPDRSVECWGDDPDAHISWAAFIMLFSPEGEFSEVGVGEHEACGLRPTGVVECWGPAWVNFDDWTPTYDVRDAGGEGYTTLSVGGEYTCALRSGGAVDCWNADRSTTYQLEGPYTAISAGYGHQCGVLETGNIHCWEGNTPGGHDWDETTFPASEEN